MLGERAWPSLAALPEVPDHAYIVTPTEAAVEAVEECGRLGVKVATVLADGFAETGREGLAREARLREICARTGIRLVGPSSLGVVDLRSKAMLTANAAFDEPDLPAGRIFAASHSGSMIGALLSRGKARGIGFAGLVSVGNEVDLSLGEICAATLDDPGIDGYMLFLETMRHAEALRRFALAAAQRGKPIIAYKLGRSAAARELAVSHTGALAGEDDVADVFLAACGIARVDTLDGLIEGLPLLARVPVATARRAQTRRRRHDHGGRRHHGGRSAGEPRRRPSSRRARRRWRGSPAPGSRSSPRGWSISPSPARATTTMKATLDILLAAPEFDLVLAVVGSSARSQPEIAVRPIIDSAGAGKPLAAFLVPDAPEALAALSRAGVPSFRTPEACADAIAAALARRAPQPIRRPRRDADASLRAGRTEPCSTSSRPTRCSSGSALRARRRSRSMPASPQAPRPALSLSGRGQGAVGRDRAQDRRRRRRARRRRRRRAARRDRSDPHRRGRTNARSARRTRAGAADGRGPRRGADRLSRRSATSARW